MKISAPNAMNHYFLKLMLTECIEALQSPTLSRGLGQARRVTKRNCKMFTLTCPRSKVS